MHQYATYFAAVHAVPSSALIAAGVDKYPSLAAPASPSHLTPNMRVSFSVELDGPDTLSSRKRMYNWIGAYRLVALAVILILALVEAGLSATTPTRQWCYVYGNSPYNRSCSVAVGLSGERKYALGVAITTSLFAVAGYLLPI
jgi:hypothetical protein